MGRRSTLLKCSKAARSSGSILKVKGILAMFAGYTPRRLMSISTFDVTPPGLDTIYSQPLGAAEGT
jgi:hypothetical protein